MAGYIGTQAVSVNTTSATISDDLAVGDDLTVTDDATIGGTLGVAGVFTANAGVVVDNFTLDGTTLALSSGDLTIDSEAAIILDANGGDVQFKDGGTSIGAIINNNSDFVFRSLVSDKDVLIKGLDGSSIITALKLDMSDEGAAIFNSTIKLGTNRGIYIGGTGSANYLDDYEEGVYGPAMTATTSGTITLNGGVNVLAYTKVGRVVHVQGLLETSAKSSPVGAVRIGLPFATADLTEYAGRLGGSITFSAGNGAATVSLPFTGVESSSVITLTVDASTVHPGGSPAYSQFYISFTYIA